MICKDCREKNHKPCAARNNDKPTPDCNCQHRLPKKGKPNVQQQ